MRAMEFTRNCQEKEASQGITCNNCIPSDFRREHPVVFLVNNKMYTQHRPTQLSIYLSLATGFGLTHHLQALVLYTKSTHNW